MMNRWRIPVVLLAMAACAAGGCNGLIAGRWRSIEPTAMAPDVVRLRDVTFTKDGRFDGTITRRHRNVPVDGTYTFDGSILVLTLTDPLAGVDRVRYHVSRIGEVLTLTQNQVSYRLALEPEAAPGPVSPILLEELTAPASQAPD